MTRKFSPSTLSLGVAFALFSANAAHATSGDFASGYGINNEAVAGVGAALPQDSLTIAINPAGLTQVGHQLNIGLDVFAPDRSANIKGNAFGPITPTMTAMASKPFTFLILVIAIHSMMM